VLIDPEVGFISKDGEASPAAAPTTVVRPPRTVSDVVRDALGGLLPRGRALREGEPAVLSALHISMVFDKALGMRTKELAEKYDTTESWVSRIIHHPDAEHLLAVIMGQVADNLTDPRARLQGYAHEALNVKVELLRTSRNDALRDRIATDFLDRAGYGAPQKLEINDHKTFSLDPETSAKLSGALDAARRVSSVDYKRFLVRGGGAPEAGPGEESRTPADATPLLLTDSTPDLEASLEESPSAEDSQEAA
jgi:hypothetical protein